MEKKTLTKKSKGVAAKPVASKVDNGFYNRGAEVGPMQVRRGRVGVFGGWAMFRHTR